MKHHLQEVDIQPTDRVVFIHIAKTAGTTFNAILEPALCGLPSFPDYNLETLLRTDLEDIKKYQFFSGHFPYRIFSDFIFPEGFIGLTFLREPVSRTISTFKFVHQLLQRDETPELSSYRDELEQIRGLSLLELFERSELRITRQFTNAQTRFIGDVPHAYTGFGKSRRGPARDFVDVNRDSLDIAKARLVETAFFGITERFQDSLFLLSYTFGWRPTLNKLHLNTTVERDDKVNISPDALASIREKISFDLELYEFAQDIFDKRLNEMTKTLLQRYGTKEHAALAHPLPAEVMMQLLEKHFIMRRNGRHRRAGILQSNTYEYFPSMPAEGLFGWYSLENSPAHGPVRWSGPGLQSGFDLPRPSGENIQVSFCILSVLHPSIIDDLSLTANDVPVVLSHSMRKDGSFIFTGEIHRKAIAGPFIRLVFTVPETVTPNSVDANNGDTRLLGIPLNWVKLETPANQLRLKFSLWLKSFLSISKFGRS